MYQHGRDFMTEEIRTERIEKKDGKVMLTITITKEITLEEKLQYQSQISLLELKLRKDKEKMSLLNEMFV
jgi:hypothetical protein